VGLRLGAALFRFWKRANTLPKAEPARQLLKLPRRRGPHEIPRAGPLAREYLPARKEITRRRMNWSGKSLEIARQLHDGQAVAVSLNALGVLAQDRGDICAAHALFEESLAVWRGVG